MRCSLKLASLALTAALAMLTFSKSIGANTPLSDAELSAGGHPLPAIFIAGDSTAAKGSGEEQQGWAEPFASFFDSSKVRVVNRARGGRSSRTFISEGLWSELMEEVRPGDVVLIQFGHNDAGAINEEPPGSTRPLRARGSLPGLGQEAVEIVNAITGKPETVRSFGWYIRKMIADVQSKQARPVLLSLTVRNIWHEDRVERGSGRYRGWAYEIAKAENVPFVDLTGLAASRLEALGEKAVAELYPKDHTHTGALGAALHAEAVVSGLKGLRPSPIVGWLSAQGEAVEADERTWLNLPVKADPSLPSLYLIGDSTVRNGRGDGAGGQWGWGDFISRHFDLARINVVNRAVGGMSSRTFLTSGHWERVREALEPGDFVVMQFGHNDSGPLNDDSRARGTIKGIGSESEDIDNQLTGRPETVYSYGAYIRQYIAEARAAGATPVVCSPVPRKIWGEDGTIARGTGSYAEWAKQVAELENAPFIDLNELVAGRYDKEGSSHVERLFADERTHTSAEGARLNAELFVAALRSLEADGLRSFLYPGSSERWNLHFQTDGEDAGADEQILVGDEVEYTRERGYGYDLGTHPKSDGSPFFFSVAVPEGNHRITVELGHPEQASSNTLKAESRRLLIEAVNTGPGETVRHHFVINTRSDRLDPPERNAPGGRAVVLNDREVGRLHWDEKLTLELNGAAPHLRSLQVEPANVPTIYLTGDSTVTDQPFEPGASWGQMLPRFLSPEVAVANHAESGETLKSFVSTLRLAKVLSAMQAGDYLLMQFGHNDQKQQWAQTYSEAQSTYKAYLKVFIAEARLRGATPILVTSVQRRNFDADGKIVNTLGEYPEAVRELAEEEGVVLIDLERASIALYEALGPDQSPLAFSADGRDITHHNNYGAYQLAKAAAAAIAKSGLPLAAHVLPEVADFNPARPDDPSTFSLAPSPLYSDQPPRGN